jgi:transcriptional regulator with XRE-family HTH domain
MDVAAVMEPIAKKLIARREELGQSQYAAARDLDVSVSAVRLWERRASLPTGQNVRKLAAYLNMPAPTLMRILGTLNAAEERALLATGTDGKVKRARRTYLQSVH